MNFKKLTAGLAAIVCSASFIAASLTGSIAVYADEEAVKDTFDVNYDGWCAPDNAELEAIAGIGIDSSRAMLVSGRQTPSDGVFSDKRYYLDGGIEYDYSIWVKADKADTFRMNLEWADIETEEVSSEEIVTKKVKAGEWTELKASFEAPENTGNYVFTLTSDTTQDFYFDEFKAVRQVNTSVVSAAPAGKGLKDEFANYFRVGNILNGGTVQNKTITDMYIKDFNAIECENETKPDATLVTSGSTNTDVKVSLNSCAAIADFCVKNNMAFRGHTLVWHSQTPEWFFKEGFNGSGAWVNSATMDQRLESYIKNMFNAFATQYPNLNLYAYDVCNECISDDSSRTANNGGAREPGYGNGKSPWVQVYGSNAFIEKAFTFARKYAPEGCKLYYNDYNEYWDHKRDSIINTILKPLYAKKVLDGMGMQSHVPANATGFAGTDSYLAAMDMFLGVGCDVQVSELDISVESGKYSYTEQANKYKAIFQHAMECNTSGKYAGKVTLVQVWGPDDGHSWLPAGSNGLLCDSSLKPKEAYTAITSILPDSQWGDGSNPAEGGGEEEPVEPNDYGWYEHEGFEESTHIFDTRGTTIDVTSGENAVEYGNNALYVSDRSSSWQGTEHSLSSRIYKPGTEYSFSVHAKYATGADSVLFQLSLQYTDSAGETQYAHIAQSYAIPGKWVQLSNTKYKIPEGASDCKIYVETADESTVSFYIDEYIGAVGGTGIAGEGSMDDPGLSNPGDSYIKGDLNGDGIINVIDAALLKLAIKSGKYASAAAEAAADVNGNLVVDKDDVEALQQFIVKKITKFPVVEPELPPIDTSLASEFSNVTYASSYKKDGENNPLTTQRFGADPGFLVYKDRLYVYTTNDAFEYDSNGQIKENSYDVGTINCVSSSDLVNWTDHGAIPVAGRNGRTTNGAAKWASASWAPDACWKTINGKDKFFLYFANSAGGIGVLTADSPAGPWTDPIGGPLITKQTANCGDVEWMFDPAVLVDDDGTGYIYFGGGVPSGKQASPGTGRCCKLGDDMISLAGAPVKMDTPYLFEDSSIIKIGNTYYYSYCTNWSVPSGTSVNGVSFGNADICYMASNDPLSWSSSNLKGNVFKNTGAQGIDNGGNNHHSIVCFKNKYYVLYHSRQQEMRMGVNGGSGLNYRSTQINECTYNASNGTLTCNGDMKGVSQLENLNPYEKVRAATMSNQGNISVSGVGDSVVNAKKGSWIKVSGVNFSKGASSLTIKASGSGAVKVTTGKVDGDVVTYAKVSNGEVTVPVNAISGTKDLYFSFSGDINFESWQFK